MPDDCPSVIMFFSKKLDIESKGRLEDLYPNSLIILLAVIRHASSFHTNRRRGCKGAAWQLGIKVPNYSTRNMSLTLIQLHSR